MLKGKEGWLGTALYSDRSCQKVSRANVLALVNGCNSLIHSLDGNLLYIVSFVGPVKMNLN